MLLAGAVPGRAAVDWGFQTMALGRALVGGGWQVTLPVGGLRGSPEFSPGLQLVYLNLRTDKGAFRGQLVLSATRKPGAAAGVTLLLTPFVTFAPFCSIMRLSGDSFRSGISIIPGADL